MIVDEIVEKEETYTVNVNSTDWRIPKRYSNLQLLGEGSFGAVCSATNRENNTVSLKAYIQFSKPGLKHQILFKEHFFQHFFY